MYFIVQLFNQPKLCPNASWGVNATTFANQPIVYSVSHGFFIDFNDTIYFPDNGDNCILVWFKNSTYPAQKFIVQLPHYTSLFVTTNGDIYFENGNETGRIDKWELNATNSTFVTRFNDSCFGLFVDINNTLYCSMRYNHQVVSISLNNNTNTSSITVAGTDTSGNAPNQLNIPWGIFVNTNFDLYVADAGNNRIQLFRPGQLSATTVAGNGIPNSLQLSLPTDVIVDADGYLFIADNVHNRIIRSGQTTYYCVAGCSGTNGPAPNQLHKPYSLRFDSQANIYVADEYNNRIQKFTILKNCTGKFHRHSKSREQMPLSTFLLEPSTTALPEIDPTTSSAMMISTQGL
jgi:hypothetical protein